MCRLKMSENCLLIICLVCKFIKFSNCFAEKNSTAWSAINLVVESRDYRNGFANIVPTTSEKVDSVFLKSEDVSTGASGLWTKIKISEPPGTTTTATRAVGKYRATLKLTAATKLEGAKAAVNGSSQENGKDAGNRSLALNTSTEVPRKGVNGETGHAFFDDDDYDDDDDDDDYDEDEDEYEEDDYPKKDKDEVEEVVEEVDPNVEEQVEAADAEAQEEYSENYVETRPPIILRTRRKNKRKHGKKHGKIKIKKFKKLKKFMLPLLLAYKLKFFTLVPLLLGGLVLMVATTGFAGFFFALFAVGLGMKHHH